MKYITPILVLVVGLAVAGCGGGGNGESEENRAVSCGFGRDEATRLCRQARTLAEAGQTEAATAAYELYLQERPADTDALVQLGRLYTLSANCLQHQAARIQAERSDDVRSDVIRSGLATTASPEQERCETLGSDQIADATPEEVAEALSEAIVAAQEEFAKVAAVYRQLTELEPKHPLHFLWLGQASQLAGDLVGAIAAYETFLILSPDDVSAPIVEGQLAELRTALEE